MDLIYLILLIPSFFFILLIVLLVRQRKVDRLFKEAISIIDFDLTETLKNDIKSPY